MLIGIVGKSNTGKTTFFTAATLVGAEISNRIFTTIEPNLGLGYVKTPCPCKKLGVVCNPKNSYCNDGTRFIPVKIIDIAGLVPGAHSGRGLGNQFLSDIMEADALIHVVDISGGTDQDGNPIQPGSRDPMEDMENLTLEIDYWILGILKKTWTQIARKAEAGHSKLADLVFKQLSGLGISPDDVKDSVEKTGLGTNSDEKRMLKFVETLRKKSKPIVVAANKIDIPEARENFAKTKKTGIDAVPCCAEAELALRRAAESGLIKYSPGNPDFEVLKELEGEQKTALEFIKENILTRYKSTGIQDILNKTVFEKLDMIVAYPVANINKLTDKKGNVLPDAHLVRKGTTLKDFAAKVHTELAEKFIGGLNLQKKKIGADYVLKDGDVVEILFK